MTKKVFLTTLSFFLVVSYFVWWLLLFFLAPGHDSAFNDYFADTYGIVAGVGGLIGIHVARRWGSFKSYVGKSINFFAAGLIAQFLGQVSYTVQYYVYGIENAYPSFGEVFYLSSIPLYIMGIWFIAKASGFTISLKSFGNRLSTIIVPVALVGISYFFFLNGYDAEDVPFNIVLLDYVYPLGQALFLSMALLTYLTTKDLLGGVMKWKVLFILFSLFFQYIADSLFILETRGETWYPGGISDLMFVLSYFLMSIGLIQFETVEEDLNRSKQPA